jgi:imidazolonepropionase-like amidohydrolase
MLAFSISSSASDLALVHVKIYPSPAAAPIPDGTILVHDGRIQAIGPSSKIKVPSSRTIPPLTSPTFPKSIK